MAILRPPHFREWTAALPVYCPNFGHLVDVDGPGFAPEAALFGVYVACLELEADPSAVVLFVILELRRRIRRLQDEEAGLEGVFVLHAATELGPLDAYPPWFGAVRVRALEIAWIDTHGTEEEAQQFLWLMDHPGLPPEGDALGSLP